MKQEKETSIYDDPTVRRVKKRPKPKSRYRFFGMVFLLLLLYATFIIGLHQWTLYQANLENQQLRIRLRELELEQQTLLELQEHIQSDAYIEFKARTELGLIAEGEKELLWMDEQ